MADRKKDRKGYNPGEDEEVYEELKGNQHKIDANKNGKVDAHDFHLLRKKKKVAEEAEELDELSHGTLRRYRMKAKSIADQGGEQRTKGRELAGRKSYGDMIGGIKKPKVMAKEEAEQIDEISKDLAIKAFAKRNAQAAKKFDDDGLPTTSAEYNKREKTGERIIKKHGVKGYSKAVGAAHKELYGEEAEQIDELSKETVRTYYNKAGEQGKKIADKMKMGGGDWSNDGSDTKTLKKRAAGRTMALKRRSGEIKMSEEAEQIDEISAEKKDAYAQKAGKQLPGLFAKSNSADGARKYYNRKNAVRKIANEDVEQVDEKLNMDKASMGTVIKDFQKSDAPQFQGKSQKKRQVMAIAAKLSAERGGKPLNKEERLLTKLADISETHKRTMVSVFEKLNEDNQREFMLACDTAEGIEQMLDFSIQHRGE